MKKLRTALVMCLKAQGFIQDHEEAAKFNRKAAEQGVADAQYSLGGMYALGEGVIQDYKEAAKWYRKAAEQGHADAQYFLGSMYENGDGIVQDNIAAYMWFNIAASSGDWDAVEGRDSLAKKMTAADISKAQELARACVAKKYKGC